MAAILHFIKWPPKKRFSLISQRDFYGKYENYTFLGSLYYRQSERNNVCICPESIMAAILHFIQWPP